MPLLYASVFSAGVLLHPFSAAADERDQLKSIQQDIAAKERAVRHRNRPLPMPRANYAKRKAAWRILIAKSAR